jgi:phosphatidylserine/phosphatidylglycerophosphate/cardiolipin synthase-like enzyme
MPADVWQQLASQLSAWEGNPTPVSIRQATEDLRNRDAAWILSQAIERSTQARWSEIAAAMTAVDCLVGNNGALTEIIWTGPANDRFPVRRVDQVLYDLISKASRRIILVTFAAHRVRHLCAHLTEALKRGVELTLIVESEGESEGQLTRDAVAAFRDVSLDTARIYYWPIAKRDRNQAGRPGKLHIKCAIIDETALVGSANLTDDAFNRNMELGLLVREQATVSALAQHFQELIGRGILVEVRQNE